MRERFVYGQSRNRNQLRLTRLSIIHTRWLDYINFPDHATLSPLFLVMFLKMNFGILKILSTSDLLLALPKMEMRLKTLMRY